MLCDCATGWKIKRNYGTFPHQSFNSLRGKHITHGSHNNQISQTIVWQGHLPNTVQCVVLVKSGVARVQSPASWVLRSNCSSSSQRAEFSDQAIVAMATAVLWSLNCVLGSVLRYCFWLTSSGSGLQSSTFLIVAEEATFLRSVVQCSGCHT